MQSMESSFEAEVKELNRVPPLRIGSVNSINIYPSKKDENLNSARTIGSSREPGLLKFDKPQIGVSRLGNNSEIIDET